MTEQLKAQWVQKSPEVKKLLQTLVDQSGGLQQFIHSLKDKKTLETLQTWAKDGKEFVLSHEQVKKLLGDARIQAIAQQLKTTPEQVTKILSENLPPILAKIEQIKGALPKIPENSAVGKALSLSKKVMGIILEKTRGNKNS